MTKNETKEKLSYYSKLIEKIELFLSEAPEGSLLVSSTRKIVRFYQEIDRKRFYIKQSNEELIKQLAQKDYCLTVKKALSVCITNNLQDCEQVLQSIFNKLHPQRKKLVSPYLGMVEQKVINWKSVEYDPCPINPDKLIYSTSKGEKVRSKSELLIADRLASCKIPYRYEYPLVLKQGNKVYPDFLIINPRTGKEFVLEHFGMMEDPDYAAKAEKKLLDYSESGYELGINLLITFESQNVGFDTNRFNRIIKLFLL